MTVLTFDFDLPLLSSWAISQQLLKPSNNKHKANLLSPDFIFSSFIRPKHSLNTEPFDDPAPALVVSNNLSCCMAGL